MVRNNNAKDYLSLTMRSAIIDRSRQNLLKTHFCCFCHLLFGLTHLENQKTNVCAAKKTSFTYPVFEGKHCIIANFLILMTL